MYTKQVVRAATAILDAVRLHYRDWGDR